MATQTMREDLRFRDLGPLEVEYADGVRPVGGSRLESALALLLIHANYPIGPDELAEAMWGDQGVRRSAATLDSHVWRLRKLLEPDRAPGAPPAVLVREPAGYRLVVGARQIDSARFAALAREAGELLATGDAYQALQRAEEAAALWRGRPYGAAADEEWARAAVARLEEIRSRLRESHVGALLDVGAVDRALEELEIALAAEPLRERLWAYRMSAYRDCGRRSDALATYLKARTVLVDELGIEPGPQLRALHIALLRDEPSDPVVATPERRELPAPQGPTSIQTLPATRSRLVGRERELTELLDLLDSRPLVTLAGAAGCGKTRLAVEAARRAKSWITDGVWFVDLTSATPERVLDTVASTLELPIAGPADPVDALRRHTASRRMLLVLDNCEHVLDAAAELVDALLAENSALVVLATSREPLEVDGEHVQRLAPLPGPAAVELFLERLDGPAPAEAQAVVGEIAAAVDGLPLALELAAARARVYTLGEIAAQVRADASTLSSIGRNRGGSSTHHRTVREAIDTSYRDLPAPLAAVHRALAAVPGPFTIGLAAGLVASDVTDAVAGLAHRSLLTPLGPARHGGASRFAQFATVRGHAHHEAQRAGEDPGAARDAWIERLVRTRPALGSTRHVGWYRALDDDLAAVRATLQHTLVTAPSGTGVALVARLRRLLGVQRNGRGRRALGADGCGGVYGRPRAGPTRRPCGTPCRPGGSLARAGPSVRGRSPGACRDCRGSGRDR